MKHSKEELTERIIEFLIKNNIDVNNSTAVFAGGALSNLIYALENNIEPYINDIDLFRITNTLEESLKLKTNYGYTGTTTTSSFLNTSTTTSLSGNMLFSGLTFSHQAFLHYTITKYPQVYFETKYFYIKSCNYVNNINYINIENNSVSPKIKSENIELLLNDFDLNCVKTAFDIETKTLYLTDDFLDFLKTKKIKITNDAKLFKSILRGFKKCEQLNLDCKQELINEHYNKLTLFIHDFNIKEDLLKLLFDSKDYFSEFDFEINYDSNNFLWNVNLKPMNSVVFMFDEKYQTDVKIDKKYTSYLKYKNIYDYFIKYNYKLYGQTLHLIQKFKLESIELILKINKLVKNNNILFNKLIICCSEKEFLKKISDEIKRV